MADYYDQFSEMIDAITAEEAAWIKLVLKMEPGEARLHQELGMDPGDEDNELYLASWPGFGWSLEKGNTRLWLHVDEGYEEEMLILFLQRFLQKFRPAGVISITGASTCSKPSIGAFGGWWLVVSAAEDRGGDVWDAAEKAKKELEQKENP